MVRESLEDAKDAKKALISHWVQAGTSRFLIPNAPTILFGVVARRIDKIAWDERCNTAGTEDFVRGVPCPPGRLCAEEEGAPGAVMKGAQFTYRVEDTNQPRYMYDCFKICE